MQGKTINGFTLKHLLGIGGMAEVWYAENNIGMRAAVKIMIEKLSHDDQMHGRFFNEAKAMVKLDHPNIRRVYGYDEIDGRPAIIMEYLDGSDLKTRMKEGQHFTDEELQRWWNQMVDALNYTHAQNIVHRDIKPSNIFVDQKGNAKLLDFGIAKVTDNSTGTQTGTTLGTRIYMSPEQVRDPKRVGTPTDVYSLAVSFVHLLSGKAPYDTTTSSDYDIQESIVRKPVDLSNVPDKWRAFLKPYLNKNPKLRPPLWPFEVLQLEETDILSIDDDNELTISEETKQTEEKPEVEQVKKTKPKSIQETKSKEKSKIRKGLWIGIGIALVTAIVIPVLLQNRDDYTRIERHLRKSSKIFDKYGINVLMDDYTKSIRQLNRGYAHCNDASECLLSLPESPFSQKHIIVDSLVNTLDTLVVDSITESDSTLTTPADSLWVSYAMRCQWIEDNYVRNIDSIVAMELGNLLSCEESKMDLVKARIRQLEEFVYIKENVDDNGLLESIEDAIALREKYRLTGNIEVTIGEVNENKVHGAFPTVSICRYTINEEIILPSEVGMVGTIKTIGYYFVRQSGSLKSDTRNVDVYMKHTSKNAFLACDWDEVTERDLVFRGDVTFDLSQRGWNTIQLQIPFKYNGIDNLLIVWDDNTGTYKTSMSHACYDTEGKRSIWTSSDSQNYNISSITSYNYCSSDAKNANVQLGIVPDVWSPPLRKQHRLGQY